MKLKKIMIAISLCLLSSCGIQRKVPWEIQYSNSNLSTYEQVYNDIKQTTDDYIKTSSITTPYWYIHKDFSDKEELGTASLTEVTILKSKEKQISLLVVVVFEEWKFLEDAWDIDGNKLKVKQSSSRVLGPSRVAEALYIPLELDYIKARQDVGLNIRVDGERGDLFIKLPSHYVKAFIDSINDQRFK